MQKLTVYAEIMQKLQTVTRKFMQTLLFMQKIYAEIMQKFSDGFGEREFERESETFFVVCPLEGSGSSLFPFEMERYQSGI